MADTKEYSAEEKARLQALAVEHQIPLTVNPLELSIIHMLCGQFHATMTGCINQALVTAATVKHLAMELGEDRFLALADRLNDILKTDEVCLQIFDLDMVDSDGRIVPLEDSNGSSS